MAEIRKYDGENWNKVSSSRATGINTSNPKLVKNDEVVTDVDTVLERHEENINTLKRNVAWLALHGGGGSGGGGNYNPSKDIEAEITVNMLPTGSTVLIDQQGMMVHLQKLSSEYSKPWKVNIQAGVVSIYNGTLSFSNNSVLIPYNKLTSNFINHACNLYIHASYTDDTNGVYGNVDWGGKIIESVVELQAYDTKTSLEQLNTNVVKWEYSVGIVGDYILDFILYKDGVKIRELPRKEVKISSTQRASYSMKTSEFLENNLNSLGVYTIECKLTYTLNSAITNSTVSVLACISDTVLIASSRLSSNIEKPTQFIINGNANIDFTAYYEVDHAYKYTIKINDYEVIHERGGDYNSLSLNPVSTLGVEWAVEDTVIPVEIIVYTNTAATEFVSKVYYIILKESDNSLIDLSDLATSHLMFSFEAHKDNIEKPYTNNNFIFNLNTTPVTTTLVPNVNNIKIEHDDNNTPYLRLNKRQYYSSTVFNISGDNRDMQTAFIDNAFTISLCFAPDYSPNDDGTIFFCGSVNAEDKVTGISIDVHGVNVNGKIVVPIIDNMTTMIDITHEAISVKKANSTLEERQYITKVFVNGVLTNINNTSDPISLSPKFYLGTRYRNGEYYNFAYSKIFSFKIFNSALSDLDIVYNYINNKVLSQYVNDMPNFGIMNHELQINFCERILDENGKNAVKCHLIDDIGGGYTANFLTENGGKLSSENIQKYAKVLGIPVMFIDASGTGGWTFNSFVLQQSKENIDIKPLEGREIQYCDPNSVDNSGVLSLKNCIIELQGTSTLADSIKNLNITVPDTTVFIPKKTWLPEQTYTLKADIVDSSHSNNAALGQFINDKLGFIAENSTTQYYPVDQNAVDNIYKSDYKKNQQPSATLKVTIEGFPVFVIIKFHAEIEGNIQTTPLGIYSFNLGRDAVRNLGFKKINEIVDKKTGINIGLINKFPYLYEDEATYNETDANACWIEIGATNTISGMEALDYGSIPEDFNTSLGDFWQDDPTILNERYEVRYPKNSDKKPSDYEMFKNFVHNIMTMPIEGTYKTDVMGKVSTVDIKGSYDLYRVNDAHVYTKTGKQCEMVETKLDGLELGFDESSAIKYFTINNMFGIHDNYGKNTTFRSWNNGPFYLGHYDLDSSMGQGNQGLLDVGVDDWYKYLTNNVNGAIGYMGDTYNKAKGLSSTLFSASANKLWLTLDTNFRRREFGNEGPSYYAREWRDLRNKTQEIVNEFNRNSLNTKYNTFVDYFVTEYFEGQTKNCGALLFNYDYKLKYLVQFTGNSYEVLKDLSKLNGRKFEYTRNWLKNRTLFLDSLMYWRDRNVENARTQFANNVELRANSTVTTTPAFLPMKTNTDIVINNKVGDTVETFYYMPANKFVNVNMGQNTNVSSPLVWTTSNIPNIIELGSDDMPLNNVNINLIQKQKASTLGGFDPEGFSKIIKLNLSGVKTLSGSFSLDAFVAGDTSTSELEELDLSYTEGAVIGGVPSAFNLNFNRRVIIGNTERLITNFSKIKRINVEYSKCINNIDLPVSVILDDLKIKGSNINNLKLKDQVYLTTLDTTDCNNLDTIFIQNCAFETLEFKKLKELETLEITDCENLKTVVIEDCEKLVNVTIQSDVELVTIKNTPLLSKLNVECPKKLVVDTANKLLAINFIDITKLEDIQLTNTSVERVSQVSSFVTPDIDKPGSNPAYDFRTCGNINNIDIRTSNIKYLRTNRDVWVPLDHSFDGCKLLSKVEGAFYIKHPSVFSDCSMLRGIYTGGNVKSWDLISGKDTTILSDYFNLKNENNEYLLKTIFEFKNKTISCFKGTGIDWADVTYILMLVALSSCDYYYSLSQTFYNCKAIETVSSQYDTFVDRYIYYRLDNVIDLNLFGGKVTLKILSPTPGENNGTLSPLTRMVSYSEGVSDNGTNNIIYENSDIFKRYPASSKYSIQKLSNMIGKFDQDDNDGSYKCDTMATFFDNIQNDSKYPLVLYNFSPTGIDYDNLIIPSNTESIQYSCFTSPGKPGTKIRFENILRNNNMLKSISGGCFGNATNPIVLSNDSFKHATNLEEIIIGARGGADAPQNREIDPTRSEFPYDILKPIGVRLKTVSGLFQGLTSNPNIQEILFPHTIFENNTNLETVTKIISNNLINIRLTSDGFTNCTKLSNLASVFMNTKFIGSIPYHLFYHGQQKNSDGSNVVKTVTHTGSHNNDVVITTNTVEVTTSPSRIDEKFQKSNDNVKYPTGTWTTTVPENSYTYLWKQVTYNFSHEPSLKKVLYYLFEDETYVLKQITVFNDDTKYNVKNVITSYQIGTDGENIPAGAWSSSIPSSYQYLWTKNEYELTKDKTVINYVSQEVINEQTGQLETIQVPVEEIIQIPAASQFVYNVTYTENDQEVVLIKCNGTKVVTSEESNFVLESQTITYEPVNTNITNLTQAFSGSTGLECYTRKVPSSETVKTNRYSFFRYNGQRIENASYIPKEMIDYGYDGNPLNNNDKPSEGTVGNNMYEEYFYDSYYKDIEPQTQYVDYTTDQGLANYFCSPDLFNYCSSDVNIEGVFANAGIKGRIPEHLLLGLTRVTSLKDMFNNCHNLRTYKVKSTGEIRLIPEKFFTYDPFVTNLQMFFANTKIAWYTNLKVFEPLRNALDIRYIFGSAEWGCVDSIKVNVALLPKEWQVSELFIKNKFIYTGLSGAFSRRILQIGNSNGSECGVCPGGTNIKFTDIKSTPEESEPRRGKLKFNDNFKFDIPHPDNTIGWVYLNWGSTIANDNAIHSGNANY